MVILTDIEGMRVWRYRYSDDFIELLLMHVAGLVMSDKPVSVNPANASSDETKPEIEL